MPEGLFDVVIIGGGLAGCCSAIMLARHNHRVLLLEKKRVPAHKLCGEFLSPESRGVFNRLGLLDDILSAGAHPVNHYRATSPGGVQTADSLPRTALGLSRYKLDSLLVDAAIDSGATFCDEAAVTSVNGSLREGFIVRTGASEFHARSVIAAYGKRARLDRKFGRGFVEEASGTVAFKAHYRGNMPPNCIELHGFSGGYCGIQQIEDERVNVCWIGQSDALKHAEGSPERMILDLADENRKLRERLAGLSRITDPFLAVSQIFLQPKSVFEGDVCMVGDSAGMIAPMCGDGMSMALDAADLAAPLLHSFLAGEISAGQFKSIYRKKWIDQFYRRMKIGRWLHAAYSRPMIARAALRACRAAPPLERWIIQETRG